VKKSRVASAFRKLECKTAAPIYVQKNDRVVFALPGGFSTADSSAKIEGCIENRRNRQNEASRIIADAQAEIHLWQVELCQVDLRVRCAEFAIMIGDRERCGNWVGKLASCAVVQCGFRKLNVTRISLTVLVHNLREICLDESLEFVCEGVLRQAQYDNDRYPDLVCYSILCDKFEEKVDA
jgi:RimJ/RimL family protein N-acetyltransferase